METRTAANHYKIWKPAYNKILIMTQGDQPLEKIAEAVKMQSNTIKKIRSSTMFKEKLEAANNTLVRKVVEKRAQRLETSEARDILTKAAPDAAKKMVQLSKIGTKEDRTQFDAAKDILDRAGLKPIEMIIAQERLYSPAEIAQAQGTLLETEAILKRLRNQSSPYLLRDGKGGNLKSSSTDKGSQNDQAEDASLQSVD